MNILGVTVYLFFGFILYHIFVSNDIISIVLLVVFGIFGLIAFFSFFIAYRQYKEKGLFLQTHGFTLQKKSVKT